MAEGERREPATAFADVPAFVRGLAYDALPEPVVASARRSLLDLCGVAAAGSRTRASAIGNTYAATQLGGSDRNARILLDGRRAGIAGAAFAGATTIDAVDGHDGHVLTKGHAGVALLPALLAIVEAHPEKQVAVVSHKATIRLLISSLLGFDQRSYRDRLDQSPASLNVLDFKGPTRARLTLFNDTSHYSATASGAPSIPEARLSRWWDKKE